MQTIPDGVTIKETVMREIIAVTKSWGWARLLIDEATGRVVIVSDYGEWSYCWRHIGDQILPQFLAGLNWDYMGEKMLNGNIRVPSDERLQSPVWLLPTWIGPLRYFHDRTSIKRRHTAKSGALLCCRCAIQTIFFNHKDFCDAMSRL